MKFAFVTALASILLVASSATAQDLTPPPPLDQQPQPQPPPPQLAPPPPMVQQAPPPPPPTEQRLDDSKKEDSGRGLEFLYLNAQAGGAFVALEAFNQSLDIQNSNSGGGLVGAEVGVRFVWLTLGLRFRYDVLSSFNMWQLNAVVGFHIPAGKWDPYVSVHGGYSAIATLDPNNLKDSASGVGGALPCTGTGCSAQDAANAITTKGGNVGFSIGVDYYLAKFFSIGIDGSFEFIFLHRDPLTLPDACTADPTCSTAAQSNPYYQNSGDAAGIGVAGSLHLALHI